MIHFLENNKKKDQIKLNQINNMGNTKSNTELNTNEKKMERNEMKSTVTKKRIQQIQQMKENQQKHEEAILSQSYNQHNSNHHLQLSHDTNTIINDMLPNVYDTAERQLNRKGLPFNKADLIAIILALDPQNSHRLYQLQTLPITDLNFIIRTIIYNPNIYQKNQSYNVIPSAPPIVIPSICEVEDVATFPPTTAELIDESSSSSISK
jgi:hypothetical protein